MGVAKVISLSVRPLNVSHLCFEVDGIVEVSPAQLGAKVAAFDFPAFYAILAIVPTVAGDASLLLFNSLEIDAAVAPFALVALRKEGRRIALAKAINARQNPYYSKYGHIADIVSRMETNYSPSVLGSKTQRLEVLAGIATDQWNLLKNAYTSENPPRTGVVKTTSSLLLSTTESRETGATFGGTTETGGTTTKGQTFEESLSAGGVDVNTPDNPFNEGILHQEVSMPPPGQMPAIIGFDQVPPGDVGKGSSFQPQTSLPVAMNEQAGTSVDTATVNETTTVNEGTESTGIALQQQTVFNTDYGYRTPYLEGAAQYERAQISLIDQQYAQFMATLNLPNLALVLQNEKNNIDGDVHRLQIAYLNTILMSPIAGTVTGIYKQPGDSVRAGEPVIRVEGSSTIFLQATVVYRGPIVIAPSGAPPPPNSTVTVQTKLFDLEPLPTPVTGTVVSARGHSDDDTWDLIVKCNNLDASNNPIFPLGYHFDFDDTDDYH